MTCSTWAPTCACLERQRNSPGSICARAEQVLRLEAALNRLNEALGPLTSFVLPGGTTWAAWCHLARTVCRRVERDVVALLRGADQSAGLHLPQSPLRCAFCPGPLGQSAWARRGSLAARRQPVLESVPKVEPWGRRSPASWRSRASGTPGTVGEEKPGFLEKPGFWNTGGNPS